MWFYHFKEPQKDLWFCLNEYTEGFFISLSNEFNSRMNSELEKALNQWRKWDKDEKTLAEIESLVTANEFSKLEGLLCKRMEFGTAGLRSKMGAGFSQMNTLTIIQGLCLIFIWTRHLNEVKYLSTIKRLSKGFLLTWKANLVKMNWEKRGSL